MQGLFLIGIPGGPEWIIIVLVILLLFGAKKIPELARGIGQGINEFRKASDDIQQEIEKGQKEGKDAGSSQKKESKKEETKKEEESTSEPDSNEPPEETKQSSN